MLVGVKPVYADEHLAPVIARLNLSSESSRLEEQQVCSLRLPRRLNAACFAVNSAWYVLPGQTRRAACRRGRRG